VSPASSSKKPVTFLVGKTKIVLPYAIVAAIGAGVYSVAGEIVKDRNAAVQRISIVESDLVLVKETLRNVEKNTTETREDVRDIRNLFLTPRRTVSKEPTP
jgi:hypothetical protein